jgi:hypothetical protein
METADRDREWRHRQALITFKTTVSIALVVRRHDHNVRKWDNCFVAIKIL